MLLVHLGPEAENKRLNAFLFHTLATTFAEKLNDKTNIKNIYSLKTKPSYSLYLLKFDTYDSCSFFPKWRSENFNFIISVMVYIVNRLPLRQYFLIH